MIVNVKTLKRECENCNWAITVDPDGTKVLITGPSTSVSVTITPNREAHLYAAGPFKEVLGIIRVLEKCAEGR